LSSPLAGILAGLAKRPKTSFGIYRAPTQYGLRIFPFCLPLNADLSRLWRAAQNSKKFFMFERVASLKNFLFCMARNGTWRPILFGYFFCWQKKNKKNLDIVFFFGTMGLDQKIWWRDTYEK